MTDKIYIVAGNMSEFRSYVDRKLRERWNRGDTSCTMSDYVFVHNADRLRGLNSIKGFYIGTYEQRSDIDQIKIQIAVIKSKKVPTSMGNSQPYIMIKHSQKKWFGDVTV